METNIQLMISSHYMDQTQKFNFDIQERMVNLGLELVTKEMMDFNSDLILGFHETLREILGTNFKDFKSIFNEQFSAVQTEVEAVTAKESKPETPSIPATPMKNEDSESTPGEPNPPMKVQKDKL